MKSPSVFRVRRFERFARRPEQGEFVELAGLGGGRKTLDFMGDKGRIQVTDGGNSKGRASGNGRVGGGGGKFGVTGIRSNVGR